MATSRKVLVFGIVGRTPVAGVAWQALHYLEGFRRNGCDVFYVEDTWDWPYDPLRNTATNDPSYTVEYIGRLMRWAGFDGRWVYRSPDRDVFGMSDSEFKGLLREADALVNVTGGTQLLEEHMRVPIRVYLETDPVLPQIGLAQGNDFVREMLSAHTHHFSFGENYGAPDCDVPILEFEYEPTRQPVVLDWWKSPPGVSTRGDSRFTTVATWDQSGDRDAEWNGKKLVWSKHGEFLKFLDLPRLSGVPFELALACGEETLELLGRNGWGVSNALELSREIAPYRDFILGSAGEFSVAKPQVVDSRSGWFSDRSACYLAAGKPVILQDTGFGRSLPTGRGLFAFRTLDEILAALDAIQSDYEGNSAEAAEIAAEHFAAERVVGSLLERAGIA